MIRSFIFCKNAQIKLTRSAVMLICLQAISGHLSEANLNNLVSTHTQWVISWKLAGILCPVVRVEPVGAV